jgi:hypothetical protein
MSKRSLVFVLPLVAALFACSGSESRAAAEKRRAEMSQRERDSILAQSGLPGAKGVGRALQASDSARARQAQIDSAIRR